MWDVRQGRSSGCFGPGAETLDVLSVALHPSMPFIAAGLGGNCPVSSLRVAAREMVQVLVHL